jgi:hypothetical protein
MIWILQDMLRPLPLDLLAVFVPLGLGAAAFVLGRSLIRLAKPLRGFIIVSTISLVVIGASSLAGLLPDRIEAVLSHVGGGTVVLSWAALLLLGFVWSIPRRPLRSGFLLALVLAAIGLQLLETGGALWWRFLAPSLWRQFADARGCLMQSSGFTCSPAAGVMLLHQHGIVASEGEMAYLAKTSFFGTDRHALADALAMKVADRGWSVKADLTDYESCLDRGVPFVAHVWRKDVGGHAVLVRRATPESVALIDPLDGYPRQVPRTQFEEMWDGTAIWIGAGKDE